VVPKDWLEIAQLVSSTAAACGLFVAACQMYRARRVADLQALQKFFDGVFEREAALVGAQDNAEAQRHAFNELLTFLEVHASAHNKNLFGPGSEEMVRHKLEDSLIELEAAKDWHQLIDSAIDRYTTLGELRKFIKKHKSEIVGRRAERAKRVAGRPSSVDIMSDLV
jgi:hypothetical protein